MHPTLVGAMLAVVAALFVMNFYAFVSQLDARSVPSAMATVEVTSAVSDEDPAAQSPR